MKRFIIVVIFYLLIISNCKTLVGQTNGTLDHTFGTNGITIQNFKNTGENSADAIDVQSDGKIVIAANLETWGTPCVVRYNTDGSFDNTFGEGGIKIIPINANLSGQFNTIKILDNGKIIVAGGGDDYGFFVVKLNSDGSLDSDFGDNGFFTGPEITGSQKSWQDIEIQGDGKIVVGGYFNNYNVSGGWDPIIARITETGEFDLSFNSTGYRIFDSGSATEDDRFFEIEIQDDGRILGCLVGQPVGVGVATGVYRLNNDGTLDTDFGTGGFATIGPGGRVWGGMQYYNSKIYISHENGIYSFNYDGTVNNNFGTLGVLLVNDRSYTDIIVNNNIIYASGADESSGGSEIIISAYDLTGNLNSSFGNNGELLFPQINDLDLSNIALSNSGYFYVAGHTGDLYTNELDAVICSFNSSGQVNASFGTDGFLRSDFGNSDDLCYGSYLQADDKILMIGYNPSSNSTTDIFVSRVNPDGTHDNTFGDGGKVVLDFSDHATSDDYGMDVIQVGNALYVCGSSENYFALIKLNMDGSLDTDFGVNGIVTTDIFGNSGSRANKLILTSNNKLLLAGSTYNADEDVAATLYDLDGNLVTTFGTAGKFSVDIGGTDRIYNVIETSTGEYLMAGTSTANGGYDFLLLRLTATGVLDNTFSDDGYMIFDFGSTDLAVGLIELQDGDFLVSGWTYTVGAGEDFAIAKIHPSGVFNGDFGGNYTGMMKYDIDNSNDRCYSLIEVNNGKFFGGAFGTKNSNQDYALVLFNSDGSVDNTYANNGVALFDLGGTDKGTRVLLNSSGDLYMTGNTNSAGLNDFGVVKIVNSYTPFIPVSVTQPTTTGANSLDFEDALVGLDINVTTTDNITCDYFGNGAPVSGSLPPGINNAAEYFWVVTSDGIVFTDGKISIPIADLNGVNDASKLRWLKRGNSGDPWTDFGGTVVGGNLESTVAFSTFSEFTVGSTDDSNPLPVELILFEGLNTEEGVILRWETATEVNNYGFEIERQVSSIEYQDSSWVKLSFVQGHGTTNSPKEYLFTDSNLPDTGSTVSYRLKQIDNDGTFAYSKIVTVDLSSITSVEEEIPVEYSLAQNYPNPFNPTTTIEYSIPKSVLVSIKIYDLLGREVRTLVNEEKSAGRYEVSFDGSELSSGIYVYSLKAGDFNKTRKLLLLK